MLMIALLIFLASVVFLIGSIRNKSDKYLYIMIGYFISCTFTLITSVMYTASVSKYSPYLFFESNIFYFLMRHAMHVTVLSNFYNLSVACYMLTSALCFLLDQKRKKRLLIPLLAPIAAFLFVNHSNTSWHVFILMNTDSAPAFLYFLYDNLGWLNPLLITLYLLLPIVSFQRSAHKTKLNFQKEYYNVLTVCNLVIDLYYMLVLNVFFRAIRYSNLTLAKLLKNPIISETNPLSVFISFIVIFAMVFLILYYQPFQSYVIRSRKEWERDMKSTSTNLNLVLHTYKNAFISINRIADTISENTETQNPEMVQFCAETLRGIAEDQLEIINRTLSLTHIQEITLTETDLKKILDAVTAEVHIPEDIRLSIRYETDHTEILGSEYYLKEAFKNLIENAVTALEKTERTEKKIEISCYLDGDFIILEFFDNGCGIEKKHIKNIFNLYYSSKQKKECGGVGLYFVRNVINQHRGKIEVMSEPGTYTSFLVMLHPRRKKRRKKTWKKSDGQSVMM